MSPPLELEAQPAILTRILRLMNASVQFVNGCKVAPGHTRIVTPVQLLVLCRSE
jgi:hypothetical protein